MKSSSNMTAARVPGAKFDKIVLHIGYWKTGTSAIQDSIVKNRKFLDELGYFTTYPRDPDLYFAFENPPNPKHEIYLRKGAKTEAQRMKIQQKKKLYFDAKMSSIPAGKYHTWLISTEQFFVLDPSSILELKNYLSRFSRNIRVLFYIREHVACAISQRSQYARAGDVPLKDLVRAESDYASVLKNWVKVFDREDMDVRLFSRNSLVKGDIVSDFFNAVGVERGLKSQGSQVNPALSDVGVRLLGKINEKMPKVINNEPNPIKNYAREVFEKHLTSGPGYVPSETEISSIEALHKESDQWVLDNFFPDQELLFERYSKKDVTPLGQDELLDQIAAAIVEIQTVASNEASYSPKRHPWKFIIPALKQRLRK